MASFFFIPILSFIYALVPCQRAARSEVPYPPFFPGFRVTLTRTIIGYTGSCHEQIGQMYFHNYTGTHTLPCHTKPLGQPKDASICFEK